MDNSALGAFGDAIIKINQAVPDAISAKTIERLTGIPIEEPEVDILEGLDEEDLLDEEEETEEGTEELDEALGMLKDLVKGL